MKVEKQNIELPIQSFEFEGGCVKNKKHGSLFPNNVRLLNVGPSGCGKTNLLLTLLINKNGLKYLNVYLFCKTSNQAKYDFLKKILDRVDGIGFYCYDNEILPPDEVAENSVCIFDDITDQHSQLFIQKYFATCRHRSIDIIFIGQTYSWFKKQLLRDNANMLALFKMDEMNLKHVYNDHVASDMTYSRFRELCNMCWEDKYGFIVIAKDYCKNKGRYRKGFDIFISV